MDAAIGLDGGEQEVAQVADRLVGDDVVLGSPGRAARVGGTADGGATGAGAGAAAGGVGLGAGAGAAALVGAAGRMTGFSAACFFFLNQPKTMVPPLLMQSDYLAGAAQIVGCKAEESRQCSAETAGRLGRQRSGP